MLVLMKKMLAMQGQGCKFKMMNLIRKRQIEQSKSYFNMLG